MKNALFVLMASALFFSCQKNIETNAPATLAAATYFNVAYGNEALQKMDVYLPAGRTTADTKVIVLIHGGGWTTGDKTDSNKFVDTLKKRFPGYAIFNLNYRLSALPANIFPAQEIDVKTAVEFIYNKRNDYLISEKFGMMGESAGAHLAMLYAYKYTTPVKIKAVASFFGPSDLTDMYYNPVNGNTLISLTLSQAIGSSPVSNPQIYIQSSPVTFITASSAVPTILLHGGMDALVSPNQSVMVKNKLTLAGIDNQYVLYPNKDHGFDWDGATFFDAFNKVQAFFSTHV